MRRMAAIAIALVALLMHAGAANAGAWCAWSDAHTYNCGFKTLDQCRATIYVSDSPIMRSFASQSMFANSFTPTQYQGTNRNKPRGCRVPRLQWVAGAGRCWKTSIVSTRSNVCF